MTFGRRASIFVFLRFSNQLQPSKTAIIEHAWLQKMDIMRMILVIGQLASVLCSANSLYPHMANSIVTLLSEMNLNGTTFLLESKDSLAKRGSEIYFKDTNNVIKLQKESQILYYDEDEKQWYLHKFGKPKKEQRPELTSKKWPVSWCLDMSDGEGGLINPSVDLQLSLEGGVGISGGLAGYNLYEGDILKLALGLSLSSSVQFSGSVVCNVQAGQYGQVFLRPYMYTVPEGRRIWVQHKKGKGLVEKGKWERTPSYNRYWVQAPIIECAVSEDSSLCTGLLPV